MVLLHLVKVMILSILMMKMSEPFEHHDKKGEMMLKGRYACFKGELVYFFAYLI